MDKAVTLLLAQNIPGAVQAAEAALAIDPGFVDASYLLAQIKSQSDPRAAINLLDKIIRDHPNDTVAYLLLGESYRNLADRLVISDNPGLGPGPDPLGNIIPPVGLPAFFFDLAIPRDPKTLYPMFGVTRRNPLRHKGRIFN